METKRISLKDLGIERVYCINLAHRVDRWESMQAEFLKLGLQPNEVIRFKAIKGTSWGYEGCRDSHLAILQECYDQDVKRFMILEDDARLINLPLENLERAIKDLIRIQWDILYMGVNLNGTTEICKWTFAPNVIRINKGGYCTHAMIFNRINTLKKILDCRSRIKKIDAFYAEQFQPAFPFNNCYAINPIIATQANGHSDITNRNNEYHDKIVDNFNSRVLSEKFIS